MCRVLHLPCSLFFFFFLSFVFIVCIHSPSTHSSRPLLARPAFPPSAAPRENRRVGKKLVFRGLTKRTLGHLVSPSGLLISTRSAQLRPDTALTCAGQPSSNPSGHGFQPPLSRLSKPAIIAMALSLVCFCVSRTVSQISLARPQR